MTLRYLPFPQSAKLPMNSYRQNRNTRLISVNNWTKIVGAVVFSAEVIAPRQEIDEAVLARIGIGVTLIGIVGDAWWSVRCLPPLTSTV
jgi:hypothetical protein